MAKPSRKLRKARARHAQSCEGKVAHRSKGEALKTAAQLKAERGRTVRAYACQTCGKWHLGNRR